MGTIIKMKRENIQYYNIPNEPFQVMGRLVPGLENGLWLVKEELYEAPYEKFYPAEEIDFADYIDNPSKAVFMYFDGEQCVGQVRIRVSWNRYCFVEDLAVARDFRGRGIGHELLKQARRWAEERELTGFALETQDVNLLACRFYRKYGFVLGGVDTMLYRNVGNAQEMALFWYFRFE